MPMILFPVEPHIYKYLFAKEAMPLKMPRLTFELHAGFEMDRRRHFTKAFARGYPTIQVLYWNKKMLSEDEYRFIQYCKYHFYNDFVIFVFTLEMRGYTLTKAIEEFMRTFGIAEDEWAFETAYKFYQRKRKLFDQLKAVILEQ